MIALKDLMDDLEIGNRVMEEIERINTERKPKSITTINNNFGAISPGTILSNYLGQTQQAQL